MSFAFIRQSLDRRHRSREIRTEEMPSTPPRPDAPLPLPQTETAPRETMVRITNIEIEFPDGQRMMIPFDEFRRQFDFPGGESRF